MNLNDNNAFRTIDKSNMIEIINFLPKQLANAWELGKSLSLPKWEGIQQVVICGLGGSAIAADMLASLIQPVCRVPVFVHRDYFLPAWATDSKTLVILSSFSGNTEEVLSSLEVGSQNKCRLIAITTGGELAHLSENNGFPSWLFQHEGPPRAAVGYSFGLLLAIFYKLQFIQDPSLEIEETIQQMIKNQETLMPSIPLAGNPAKRLAGQLMDRWVVFFGAEFLAPVARRWKGQVNELAKAWAAFEQLPEADHNTLAGLCFPQNNFAHFMAIFLRSSHYHPRNLKRTDLTKQAFLCEGLNIDFYEAKGSTSMVQQWTALHFGDYVAYYLAMLYHTDPTPIEALDEFKQSMKSS